MFMLDLKQLLFFLPLLILAACLIPKKWKSAVLTVGGLAMCAMSGWKLLLYAVLSVFFGWFAVRCCPRTLTGPYAAKARAWITISILLQTGCLVLSGCHLLILLSAIQAVICVIDRAHGMLRIPSLPQYLCYVCEYPRWFGLNPTDFETYLSAQESRRPFEIERFANGLGKIITGVFQIVILSRPISLFYQMIIEPQFPQQLSFSDGWLCAVAYYCFLYFLLHGWLDIGQGILLVLGYDQPDGYESPTFSTSLAEYLEKIWKPMRTAAGDIVGIPVPSAKMPTAKWFFAALVCMLAAGLIFSDSLLCGLSWGCAAASVLLLERIIPQSFRMKIPKAVRTVCVNFIIILFTYALFGCNANGHASGILSLIGKGGFALSSAALYALSWYWVELLLCIVSLFPLRRLFAAMTRKYAILEKAGTVIVPVMQLSMLVLCIMYLVASGVY